jgi:2-aminoadipate transaminase
MNEPLRTAQINTPPGMIDLGRGDPQFELLPLEVLRRAAAERLGGSDNAFLQYGAERGDGYFRVALSRFLTESGGLSVDPDTLFVTSGISSALDLVCTLWTSKGDTVFVEEPSYFLALRIFADHGLRVVSIPTDESGLIPDALEVALKEQRPKFLYFIPVFQNPTGRTLTPERRHQLLGIAREHNLPLIADEVYQLLQYADPPPPPFGAHTEDEQVVSLGSFSKILAPGLRLGWVQAHPNLVQRFADSGLLDSGGGMNPFTSAIVRSVIESGDLRHNIDHLVSVYARRVDAMNAALKRQMPAADFTAPAGGYFFWLHMPGIDAAALRESALHHDVDFRPGSLFSSRGSLQDYLRLSISFYEADDISEGVARLAASRQD